MLEHCLADQVKGRRLLDHGGFAQPTLDESLGSRSQQLLYDEACETIRISEETHRTGFVPHWAPGRETTEP